ncbi:MAG: ABC transporter permease [Bryobacteraceae bacterium]|nr:ABC transporter permease [Bryobacteraceae bacterium]
MTGSTTLSSMRLALDTLWSHKLRAALTVLGVVIGTGTIIGVGSILTGFDGAVTGVLQSFGTNTLFVFKFRIGMVVGNRTPEERARKPVSYEQVRAVAEGCTECARVSPLLFGNWNSIINAKYGGNESYQLSFNGADEGYAESGQGELYLGRFFTDAESVRRMPVVVLGFDVYKALFSNSDPLGKWIDIDGHKYEVIGVLTRGPESALGDQDKRAIIPYWTMRKMAPSAREHLVMAVAKPGRMAQAEDQIRSIMRQERRVPHDKPDNFFISTSEQMIENFRSVTAMTFLVMIVLSSIGLLVGGIGVMNIMLVSVTERTREIGIRKALGARRSDIVAQFLTEAVVLTFLGGLLGMTFGWGIAAASRIAFPNLPVTVPLWAAAAGVVVSVGIGLFFGIWPANKAARLDPVVALRYE